MSNTFHDCLEVTIRYLEHLRGLGMRHVPVSPALLSAFNAPAPTPPLPAVPTPTRPSAARAPSPAAKASPKTPDPRPLPPQPALDLRPASSGGPDPFRSAEAVAEAMAELRSRALACTKCPHLVASRTQVVFGVGNIHSPLMFVGEAPGADEDAQGEPFVGRAGQLLTRIIVAMGFERNTVYIANILKCRPDTPGQSSGNRKPTSAEMNTCLPYLREQIALIQPRVIVALGATAIEGLFGRAMPITRVRGSWLEFGGTPVMPTYHPAYLLRNQSLAEKRKVWEDMLQVLERLEIPITEKQRRFFRDASAA